jgi:hypothetical protein
VLVVTAPHAAAFVLVLAAMAGAAIVFSLSPPDVMRDKVVLRQRRQVTPETPLEINRSEQRKNLRGLGPTASDG